MTQHIYNKNMLLAWVEPESETDSSPQVWFIHAQDAAAIQIDIANNKGYKYFSPVEAMIDFMAVHWAITEPTFHYAK